MRLSAGDGELVADEHPLYRLTGLGVTVGLHRLLTHRASKSGRVVRETVRFSVILIVRMLVTVVSGVVPFGVSSMLMSDGCSYIRPTVWAGFSGDPE